jgi:hypothetical protein
MDNTGFFRRSAKYILITLAGIIILVSICSAILSAYYEKAVIKYLKGYLGEHLTTELSMDDIRFRLLRGFPKITVEITDMVLLSGDEFSRRDFGYTWSDTLMEARSVYMQFDLLKMLRKKYELKKIVVNDGTVNVLFDSKDRHNLSVWKSSDSSSAGYTVNLRNIEFYNTKLRVVALTNDVNLVARVEKLQFRGNYTGNILSGDTKGTLKIGTLDVLKKNLVKDADFQLAVKMAWGGYHIRIPSGKVQLNKAAGNISLEYNGGKHSNINLTLSIPKFGLDEVMSIIPYSTRFSTGDYAFSGNGKLNLTLKGELSAQKRLMVRSDFMLDHCTAKNTRTRSSVTSLSLKGTVSGWNAADFRLQIDTMSAVLGKGYINGRIDVKNSKSPYFTSHLNTLIDLKALKEFIALDSIDEMGGLIRSNINVEGYLKNFSTDSSASALKFLQKGFFRFENVSLTIRSLPLDLQEVYGAAEWNNTIHLDSVSMKMNNSEMKIQGELENLVNYILYDGNLKADLDISVDKIDITKYLRKTSSSSGNKSGNRSFALFPDRIWLKSDIHSKSFIAGRFEAMAVNVSLQARKDSIYMNKIGFRFPDGLITGSALISFDRQNKYTIVCDVQPDKINIQELFYEFDNFTQSFILDKNLRGQLAGSLSCFVQWDSALNLIPASISARGNFKISNGELVQFEPMLKLSKYIDVQELKHIRFKTLENTITINNRIVEIPEMDIHSSAFNISVEGTHNFDNEFEYHLRVLLSEVLFNKARNKKKEIDDFLIEDNPQERTTIPLIVAGTPDDFDVNLDRRKVFGLGNKNRNDRKENIKPPSENVKIEWDDPVKETKQQKTTTKSNSSDVVIEWDE